MHTYNTIMKYFWLSAGLIIFFAVTILGISQGFDKWAVYYIFVFTSIGMYFFKSYMMKRFEKHTEYLNQKKDPSEDHKL